MGNIQICKCLNEEPMRTSEINTDDSDIKTFNKLQNSACMVDNFLFTGEKKNETLLCTNSSLQATDSPIKFEKSKNNNKNYRQICSCKQSI